MPTHHVFGKLLLAATVVVSIGCGLQLTPSGSQAGKSGPTVDRVCDVTARLLNVNRSKVNEKTSLASLGADDLDFVELVMELEDQFNIVIGDEVAEELMGSKEGSKGMKNVTMARLAGLVDDLRN